ncbi:MAG: FHA domain-containing protein [Ectothiorhodospiraceae bacterium]|nr:FHA domain-containing protein [Ectothiorhodospiraceae bacterium]
MTLTSSVVSRELVVLYADVAGSTQLYETHGDEVARDAVGACVALMIETVQRFGGSVVKTIGDEVMSTFATPVKAVLASTEIQGAVRSAGASGRFATGALRVKIGLHFGPALVDAVDVYGEAQRVAAVLVKEAKADQILVSGATLDAVPPEVRAGARFVDRVLVEGQARPVEAWELIWEVGGLTQMAGGARPAGPGRVASLRIRYGEHAVEVDASRPVLTIGRTAANDLVVQSDLTSRSHAEIAQRGGRFHLRDISSNGTLVLTAAGEVLRLRREDHVLEGRGRICLGGTFEDNPDAVLEYEVG